jgi:hypothetical protein
MDSALIDQTSEQFLGQWKRLVSTTNWEKGQIIHAWRTALIDSGAASAEFSDEAWSRRVGNVTPQHVGRLRRAFERFGTTRDEYAGLYWSHFQAALDWDDAEMWLEGATQNAWSISEMRQQRWEALGGLAETQSNDESADHEPWDEDGESADSSDGVVTGTLGTVQSLDATVDADDASEGLFEDDDNEAAQAQHDEGAEETSAAPAALPQLPALPADVNDAFELFKLCIVRHRMAGWREMAREDMIATLHWLEQLAMAPASAS